MTKDIKEVGRFTNVTSAINHLMEDQKVSTTATVFSKVVNTF